MIRLIGYFIAFALFIVAMVWLINNPGYVEFNWFGYQIKQSMAVFVAALIILIVICIFLWRLFRGIIGAPDAFGLFLNSRRQRKGYDALSKGIIAVGSGDVKAAHKFAGLADKKLKDEPLTLLLKAQTAQLEGNKALATEAFERMITQDATKMLGLRGLFVEAKRNDDNETALLIAKDAVTYDVHSKWALNGLFDLQTITGDWNGALSSLKLIARLSGSTVKDIKRKRGVLLTAEAADAEEKNPDIALELALEAKNNTPDLVPTSLLIGRLLLAKGSVRKAHKLLEKCWRLSPHPDLATLFAKAKDGEKAKARLKRVQNFANKAGLGNASSKQQAKIEAAVIVARVAIEQEEWAVARNALDGITADDPSARVCTLMAKIEQGEFGNKGLVAEWLARAQNAPADPMWIADGHIAEKWLPISTLTGELDAYEWKLPSYNFAQVEADLAANILLEHQVNETLLIEAQQKTIAQAETVAQELADKKTDEDETAKNDENLGESETILLDEKPLEPEPQPEEKTKKEKNLEKTPTIVSEDKNSSPYSTSPAVSALSGENAIGIVRRPDDPGFVGKDEGVNFSAKEKIGYYTNNK